MGVKDAWKALFKQANQTQSKPQMGEVGFSGSRIFSGLPLEEYLPELQFPKSTWEYDRMLRSDGQIAAVYTAVTLPIRSTDWYIKPDPDADNQTQAEEIAEFIEDNLFGGMKYSWDDHLREALLMLAYGFSIFEKVYKTDMWNGKAVIVLDKYAPRVAKSIWRFPQDQNMNIVAVEQLNQMTGDMRTIPIERCRIYTYNRIGDNISGISMFRPAYKHWYIKDSLYKLQAVGIEKSMIGIPYAVLAKGTSEQESDKILEVLTAARVSEEAAMTFPYDTTVGELSMSSGINESLAVVEHHNTAISKSVLAQFIDLGTLSSASGGSYSLGNVMVDMFAKNLEAIANYIQGEVNKDIADLVAWNFGPDAPVPTLEHKKIEFANMAEVAQALYWLGAGHLVNPDVDLENFIRDMFGLPEMPRQALDNQLELPPNRYVPDIVPDDPMTPKEENLVAQRIAQAGGSGKGGSSPSTQMHELTRCNQCGGIGWMVVGKVVCTKCGGSGNVTNMHEHTQKKTVKFDDAEQTDAGTDTGTKVAVGGMVVATQWDSMEQQMQSNLQAILRQASQSYINSVARILNDKNLSTAQQITQVQMLQMPLNAKYTSEIQNHITNAYNYGQETAAKELEADKEALKTPQADATYFRAKAQELAQLQLQKLTSSLNINAMSQIQREIPPKQIIHGLKQSSEAYITGPELKVTGNIAVGEAINIGRGSAAKQIGIAGARWSAVLDSKACPLCAELDGKVISVDNPDFDVFRPPLHPNCRCILVYIKSDQTNIHYNWETPSHALVKRYGSLINH